MVAPSLNVTTVVSHCRFPCIVSSNTIVTCKRLGVFCGISHQLLEKTKTKTKQHSSETINTRGGTERLKRNEEDLKFNDFKNAVKGRRTFSLSSTLTNTS